MQYSMYCMDGMVVWVHPSVQNEVVSFEKGVLVGLYKSALLLFGLVKVQRQIIIYNLHIF